MSFCKHKSIIEIGDTVLIYLTPKQMYPIKVTENEVFQTRFGALKHNDLIGKKYGSKIQCIKGFVHVLDMTPELWTMTLPHRTQILYGTDISFILIQLDLKPGSLVIEAGTGSGSLSHCIARTISPNGKLMTFDFHQDRALAAGEEFKNHGLDSIITVQHRDVCSDGFNVEFLVDAVFLDLPHPWEAIESAYKSLNNGGRICCFSPCIEQVQKTSNQMRKINFMDIETYECLLRPYEVRELSLKNYKFEKPKENKVKIDIDESITDHVSNRNSDRDECFEENDCSQTKKLKTEQNGSSNIDNYKNYLISCMNNEVAGHTGFLTFATKFIQTL